MALRGDLVGEAYVRITADTTAMRDAIKRDGERTGKAWANAFSNEVDSIADDRMRRLHTRLAAAMSDPKEFNALAKNYDNVSDAAEHFTRIIKQQSREGKLAKGKLDEYRNAIDTWRVSTIEAAKAQAEMTEREKAAAEARTVQTRSLQNFFKIQNDGYKKIVATQHKQSLAIERQSAAWSTYGKNLLAASKLEEVVVSRESQGRFSRWVDNTVIGVDKVDRRFTRFNFIVGRAFGKGSRNNFLNWTGSMVQGLMQLGTSIVTFPAKALAHISNSFGDAFSAARAVGMGKFASAGKGLLAVFGGKGGLVGVVFGAVVGLLALTKLLPGVVSLMSGLAGVVGAVVGSISIGLTGALLAIVPAAAAGVTGLGALIGVFTSFFRNEKNKRFVENLFKPFKDLNESYYPQVRTFLTNVSRGFDDLIRDIRPSIDSFFSSWQKKMNDVTTSGALSKWSDSIGRMANSLSLATSSFASGLTGFFVPILPYAERLATAIKNMAYDFDRWANSKGGQEKITGFMSRAWVAADKLWRILGNIGGIIGRVFMIGENTGTTLLDRMLQKLQEIQDKLKTEAGKKRLKEWFEGVEGLGRDLGELATQLGTIIKNLNSKEGQENAKNLMDAIVKIGDGAVKMSELADSINDVFDALARPIPTLAAKILGFGAEKVATPGGKPQSVPTPKTATAKPTASLDAYVQKIKVVADKSEYDRTLSAVQKYKATSVKIPIVGNETLWNEVKGTIAQTVFEDKSVSVYGNTDSWDLTKGTIAANVFDPKTIPVTADTTEWDSASGRTQAYGFSPKPVVVEGKDGPWQGVKQKVAADLFKTKNVSVAGEPSKWDRTKGTVAGYKFAPKTVSITADASGVSAAVASARRYLASLPRTTTVRIAGVNSVGGLTTASGGTFDGAQTRIIGEAGPEAVVPLDRPLSQVDPSVRWLSAIAQGLVPRMARGGVVGGPQVTVLPGAIVVQSNQDPARIAQQVVDKLAEQFR